MIFFFNIVTRRERCIHISVFFKPNIRATKELPTTKPLTSRVSARLLLDIGVKSDQIWTDNAYTVSYFIFFFEFGSKMNSDLNTGLCGFEHGTIMERRWIGNGHLPY